MKLKNLCSLFIILFSLTTLNLDAAGYRKHEVPSQTLESQPVTATQKKNSRPYTDWVVPVLNEAESTTQHEHQNHQENFHYGRVKRRRNRLLWIVLIKVMLILMHAGTLLGATFHLLHIH